MDMEGRQKQLIFTVIKLSLVFTLFFLLVDPLFVLYFDFIPLLRTRHKPSEPTGVLVDVLQGLTVAPPEVSSPSFIIATGSSSSHYPCPTNTFFLSLRLAVSKLTQHPLILYYDLGLSDDQQHNLLQSYDKYFTSYIKLNYTAYPEFWNITQNVGQYAWRPGVLDDLRQRYPKVPLIIWLDANVHVTEAFFFHVINEVNENGIWTASGEFHLESYTHPDMFTYLNHTGYPSLQANMCSAKVIAFDPRHEKVSKEVIDPWVACAWTKNCIAPPGSTLAVHRYDESALTYFMAKSGRMCDDTPVDKTYIRRHREFCETDERRLKQMLKSLYNYV